MAISTLTASMKVSAQWNAANSITGLSSGITNNNTVNKSVSISSSISSSALGGGNEAASWIQSIAGAGSATIDLQAILNVVGVTPTNLLRVKAILIQLLSVADDSVVGSACSSISVGNAAANQWVSQSSSGWLIGTNDLIAIPSSGILAFGVANAPGVAVDATHKDLKILNNDAVAAAKVRITIFGATN